MDKLPEEQRPIIATNKNEIQRLINQGVPFNTPSLASQKARKLREERQAKNPKAKITTLDLISKFHVCQFRDTLQKDDTWKVSEDACGQGFVDGEGYRRHVQEKHLDRTIDSRKDLKL